jgi:shikimate kinase
LSNTIFLTGFMGTGKSRVGRVLARLLGCPFFDTDAEIERTTGLSISEIFDQQGEAAFRRMERQVLEGLGEEDRVVATGGGTVLDSENRAVMRHVGRIICLSARPETIVRRVGNGDTRPLLSGSADREGRVRELLTIRARAYQDADLVVDTSDLPTDAVARKIMIWMGV